MEHVADYSHAIAALALLALIQLALSPAAGLARNASDAVPGAMPKADYGDINYRICRAYQNASEMMGVFAASILAAILAGAAPFWINLFAALAVLARLAMVFVHIKGIGLGREPGPRSVFYVLSWLMCVLIAVFALFSVF